MSIAPLTANKTKTHIRYWILFIIFMVTAINYADRSTLSIAGPHVARDLGLDPLQMGYIFSAFGWAYLIMQILGCWLLDRYGSKKVYSYSLFFWSLFTFLQGFVGFFPIAYAAIMLFILRFMVGFAEAPVMPANSRIASAWFPVRERGTASAIFNISQYAALVVFNPLLGWLTYTWGWEHVFIVMGAVGIVLSAVWVKTMYSPLNHPRVSQSELEYLREGGALVEMDSPAAGKKEGPHWSDVRQMLTSRMMLGVFFGQYFINSITWFFLTWFPIYLVQDKGMSILKVGLVASIPALCSFAGGVLGGIVSDNLLRRGFSLTVARKIPIVLGMLLATSIILCNYTDNTVVVVALMALAFFGKGFGALGWTVVADTAPKEMIGLCGGVLNLVTQIGAITKPIVIGYILQRTGSFDGALIYVAANGLMVIVSYLFIVGKIQRLELKPLAA